MASISGSDSKYKDGHQIQFKGADKLSRTVAAQVKKLGYIPADTIFSLMKPTKKPKADHLIEVTKDGKEELYIKDPKNKVILLVGSQTSIDGCFNHAAGESSKGDTNIKTEIKEKVSMWIFESAIERNTILDENQILQKLDSASKKYYSTVYYESALKQLEALKKNITRGGYTYERQRDDKTEALYTLARKLSGKSNDNWNPADVWMIRKTYDLKKVVDSCDTIAALNSAIATAIKNKDLVPISLKQVEGKAKAKYSIVDPEKSGEDIDIDFSFEKVDLSESFNNFILFTKGGFGLRVGYKASSTNFGVYLEGRMTGAKSQLGAVDKKAFVEYIKNNYSFDVRSGSNAPAVSEHALAKKELKKIFTKYNRISNKIANEKEALDLYVKGDDAIKGRFSNIISFLYALIVLPSSEKDFKEVMKYCYLSAKKITGGACMYVLINEA